MALQFLGYVSENDIVDVAYSSLWKRDLTGKHTSIEFKSGQNVIFHSSPNEVDYPIEVFAIDPTHLHVLHSTVEEQNTFIWWVLFSLLLGILLVGIIATTSMYRVCQMKPACSGGASCQLLH